MKTDPRQDISLITLSGQLLLEAEHRVAELEAALCQERDARAAAEKSFAAFYLAHPVEKHEESPVWQEKCTALESLVARLEGDIKREQAGRAEADRRCDQMTAALNALSRDEPADLKISFERGQDGKIKSPLRIN